MAKISTIESLLNKAKRILIVSNDAGGGNVLISYAQKLEKHLIFLVSGPSLEIAKTNGISQQYIVSELKEVDFLNIDLIIASTGWSTDFEILAIDRGLLENVPTLVMFDHWSNYPNRLVHKGRKLRPNGIMVNDEQAYQLAQECYPEIEVKKIENEYLVRVKKEYEAQLPKCKKCTYNVILYLCEPTEESQYFPVESRRDYSRLEDFLAYTNHITDLKIIVRPHPSEFKKKYNGLIEKSTHPIEISSEKNLAVDFARSHVCVGYETMALHVAKSLNIPSFYLDNRFELEKEKFENLVNNCGENNV